MFVAHLKSSAPVSDKVFGPFLSEFAARDWALEAVEIGLLPDCIVTVSKVSEPVDLGFDPGL